MISLDVIRPVDTRLAALRAWVASRLEGAEQFASPLPAAEGSVEYLPLPTRGASVQMFAIAEHRVVQGWGLSLEEAVSRFQYDWDMHAAMPWRVWRIWWRVAPTIEGKRDFASGQTIFQAFCRFSYRPLES